MATKIVTKNSSTAGAAPTATDLVQGELAVNVADKRLYTEDNAGAIVELGTNPTTLNVNGTASVSASNAKIRLFETDTTDLNTQLQNQAGDFSISKLDDDAGSLTAHFNIDHATGNVSIPSGNLDVTGTATMDGLTTSLGIDVNGTDDLRVRFLNGGSFKGGAQVATTSGDMITGSAVDDLAIRSQSNMLFSTGGSTERMRIDSSGNVGIGNSSPSAKFTNYKNTSVSGAAGATLSLEINQEPRMLFTSDSSTSYISSFDSNPITFSVTAGNFASGTGTERMRIDSSGNVGIGTSSPAKPLEISSNSSQIRISTASAPANYYTDFQSAYDSANPFKIAGHYNGTTVDFLKITAGGGFTSPVLQLGNGMTTTALYTGATERMRIDASGNLLVGNTGLYSATPTLQGKIRLSKHSLTEDGGLEFVATDFSAGYGWRVQSNDYGSGDTRLSFFSRSNSASWTERVKFNENGSAYNSTGTWGSLSDGTLKENVRPSTSQWEDIKALNIVNYSFIEDSLDSPDKIGVIAQELEESGMGSLVETGGDGIKTVKSSVMHTKALKALQEAMARIETLEARITELENN